MTKLNDLQLVLLFAAAQRDDGSLLPPPEHLADQAARIRKTIPPLIKRALVAEAATNDPAKVWREEGDDRFALVITEAGRACIGVVNEQGAPTTASAGEIAGVPPATPSRSEQVLGLLRREEGASLDELVSATGWLPHSTRAALT
ncbi:MAG: DUF3489 domain-containing protein, partial [Alphaproteobacteria bacterium]|nr:DUF3489 domain-containing protein [Alphaproteobacteria bacterium]